MTDIYEFLQQLKDWLDNLAQEIDPGRGKRPKPSEVSSDENQRAKK